MAPLKEGGEDAYMGAYGDYYPDDEFWSSGHNPSTSGEQAYHHQPTAGPSQSKSHKDKGKSKDKDKNKEKDNGKSRHRTSTSSKSSSSSGSKSKGKGKASSGEGNFRCEDCGRQYTHAHLLNKHMDRHKLPYPCPYPYEPYCSESKASSKELLRHIWAAHKLFAEEEGYQPIGAVCPDCEMEFTRADNLRQHLKDGRCKGKGVARGN